MKGLQVEATWAVPVKDGLSYSIFRSGPEWVDW